MWVKVGDKTGRVRLVFSFRGLGKSEFGEGNGRRLAVVQGGMKMIYSIHKILKYKNNQVEQLQRK